MLDALLNWLFSYTQPGARRRVIALAVLLLVLWLVLAALSSPARQSAGVDWLSQTAAALINRAVLRTFLVFGLAMFIGWVAASAYLDDIFELNDISVAEKHVLKATFASLYEVLRIQNGAVAPEASNSPLVRIGGPGLVDVHMENAALFEKPDGTPHIIGPTLSRPAVLDGFERLRQIVDLRDQVLELTVSGRTKDGIPVTAKDVQLVFSVARGNRNPGPDDSFAQPYPFTENAISHLVYKQGTGSWVNAMRGMIRSELRQFISQHLLSEFLSSPSGDVDGDSFVSRDQITNLFYDFTAGFCERAETRGVELHWIGVGTWSTPSQIIPERHLEAWKLSNDAAARQSPAVLEQLKQDSRLAELLRLIDELVSAFYQQRGQGVDSDALRRDLLLSYREKLRSAQELYQNQGQPEPPELEAVLRHLDMLAAVRLGRERMKHAPTSLENLSHSGPIVVIGASGLDLIGRLKEDLLPNTSNPAQIRTSFGGAARNVAENLARLGETVTLLTVVGDDQIGDRLLIVTEDAGVDVSRVLRNTDHPTNTYLAIVDAGGTLQYAIDDMRAMPLLSPDYIDSNAELIKQASLIFLDANVPKETLKRIFSLARHDQKPVVADPTSTGLATRLLPYLSDLLIVTPNCNEVTTLTGISFNPSNRRQAMQAAKHLVSLGVGLALVSLGQYGVCYATSETSGSIPAVRTRVIDPTGAGDAMTATLIFALLNDIELDDAMRLGVTAASLALSYPGAVVPDLSLEQLYDKLVI